MKTSTKIMIAGAAVLAGVVVLLSARDDGDDGDGDSGLGTPDDPFAGPAAGGRLKGRNVTDTLLRVGSLPPGAILLAGDNLVGRGLAIAKLELAGADYGIADREVLDNFIDDERLEDVNISTANLVLVGISPDGKVARTYTLPPMAAEEMPDAIDAIVEFTAQKKNP